MCAGACLPTPPTSYTPASTANHPSFAGYPVVTLAYDSSTGVCTAASNVGPISYGGSAPGPTATWSVTAGDTIQQILSEIGFGVIIEVPQGALCNVTQPSTPITSACGNGGLSNYYLTLCTLAVDPLATGGSINAANHRWIVLRTHQVAATDFPPLGYRLTPSWPQFSKVASLVSQHANGAQSGANGVEVLATDVSQTSYTIPVHHYWIENLVTTTGVSGNHGIAMMFGTAGNSTIEQYPPVYIVLEHVALIGATRVANTTTSHGGIFGIPGGFFDLTDSYLAVYDDENLPQGMYLTDCGGGKGPINLDNNGVQAYGQGIYVETNGPPYCQPPAPTSPSTANPTSSYDDVTITHSTFFNPLSTLAGNAAWDGLQRASPRNQLEWKIGRRWLIQGNLCNGQWAGQTEGECFAMTPSGQATVFGETGSNNASVISNLITNAAIPMTFSGTRTLDNAGPPDPSITRALLMMGNYTFNIGKNKFSMTGTTCNTQPCGSGIAPGLFSSSNQAQDVTEIYNTWPSISGDSGSSGGFFDPVWLAVQSPSVGAGWTSRYNIKSLDGGGVAAWGILGGSPGSCCTSFPPSPVSTCPNISACWTQSLPGVNWGANVVIPGLYGNMSTPWTGMTDSQASTLEASNPSGDTLITAAGCGSSNCLPLHLAAAGIPGLNSGNPSVTATTQNPNAAGANLQALQSALGITQVTGIYPGTTGIAFTYLAPDSRACSVDVYQSGTALSRTTDSGGPRQRTTTVNGLTAANSYQAMIECYYPQAPANNVALTAPWLTAAQLLTEQAVSTVASGTRTVIVGGTLPSGTASVVVSLAPVVGSTATATCNSFPCAVTSVVAGVNQQTITYWSGTGGTGHIVNISEPTWVQ